MPRPSRRVLLGAALIAAPLIATLATLAALPTDAPTSAPRAPGLAAALAAGRLSLVDRDPAAPPIDLERVAGQWRAVAGRVSLPACRAERVRLTELPDGSVEMTGCGAPRRMHFATR